MFENVRTLPSATAGAEKVLFVTKSGLSILANAVRQALSSLARSRSRSRRIMGLRVSPGHLVIYLGHVSLGLSQRLLARAFERDRATVRYICARIEDFRDVKSFDRMLDVVEAAAMAFIRAFYIQSVEAR